VEISSLTNVVPSGRHVISVTISPAAGGKIVAGTWVLTLTVTAGTEVDLDSWIDLDRTDQHPRFHQDDQTRIRTLTTPATAKNVITIGSYDPRDSTLANSSSRGPTVDPRPNIKPEICAPGVGIFAAKSVGRHTGCCCDCCYDFYVAMSGTSMAAPHVTGIVALMLQRNRTLTYLDVRKSLIASHRDPDPITGPTLPNGDWGAGKVDAEKAVTDVVPHALAPSAPPLHAVPDAEPLVLPIAAYSATYLPQRARLRALQERVGDGPAAQLAGSLVSTHVDEVLRLINANRRVALAWHRVHGPVLLRLLLAAGDAGAPLLPATLGGQPVAAGLGRLLDELERWGSPALRADINRHRAFVLALPGARLDDLGRRRAS
jgi:subtilisin family serine protease